MSFDGGFCRAIKTNLEDRIVGAKIEKINCPSKDSLQLMLYSGGGIKISHNEVVRRASIIISINPSYPSINFEETLGDNPSSPSSFCMLLRKHLSSAIITEVEQHGFDRVLFLHLAKRDELGYTDKKVLVLEMMGKHSNIFLLNSENKILGSVYSSDITESQRSTFVNSLYEPPQQDKIEPELISEDNFYRLLSAPENAEKRCGNFLLQSFIGISPLISREIVARTTTNSDIAVKDINHNMLWKSFSELISDANAGGEKPVIILDNKKIVAYSFTNLSQYRSLKQKFYDDIFALLSGLKAIKGSGQRDNRKSQIQKLIDRQKLRIKKVIVVRQNELEKCKKMDEYKNFGDLINTYIYMLHKGQENAQLTDYATGETINIPLNPKLNPAANAQYYYKLYRKLGNAKKKQTQLIKDSFAELEYLDTVEYALEDAYTEREIEDIRTELADNNYVSQVSQNRKQTIIHRTKKSVPLIFKTKNGYTVKVGKNNIQNDLLTFSAHRDDLWFHVQKRPGSHVILYTNGSEPPEEDCVEAAQIAAYYSQAREEKGVNVDYTLKRYLKKPKGARTGLVFYNKFSTIFVKPQDGINIKDSTVPNT